MACSALRTRDPGDRAVHLAGAVPVACAAGPERQSGLRGTENLDDLNSTQEPCANPFSHISVTYQIYTTYAA